MSVKIGDTFRATYADSNPEWRVVRRSGKSAVIAVSLPETVNGVTYDDYAGVEQAFTIKQVEAAKRWASTLNRLGDAQEDFFASLSLGDIVHYNDGFDNFVRCEIVVGTPENVSRGNDDLVGKLIMQPVALVGNWRQHDLPRRNAQGEIALGYHAEKIVNVNGAWRANEGCIFESPGYSYSRRNREVVDPTSLPAIDLSVPEMTEAEKLDAAAEQLRAAMIDRLQDYKLDGREAIAAALALVIPVA